MTRRWPTRQKNVHGWDYGYGKEKTDVQQLGNNTVYFYIPCINPTNVGIIISKRQFLMS